MIPDRIEKQIVLRASRQRVWRALTDSAEFGVWFGVRFDGPFVAGANVRGVLVPTTIDAEIAKLQQPYEGMAFEIAVETLEPERRFAFRWHPYVVEPGTEFASEPTTLVTFELDEVPEGVRLTVVESGFERVPLARRAEAFSSNDEGWGQQMKLIEGYLAGGR